MKVDIHNNGASVTVRRVTFGLDGNSRLKFTVNLKEKYLARNYSIGEGPGEITIDFLGLGEDYHKDSFTRVTFVAENDSEKYFLHTWILLEDPGKYELRLWLVAPVCDECELVLYTDEE